MVSRTVLTVLVTAKALSKPLKPGVFVSFLLAGFETLLLVADLEIRQPDRKVAVWSILETPDEGDIFLFLFKRNFGVVLAVDIVDAVGPTPEIPAAGLAIATIRRAVLSVAVSAETLTIPLKTSVTETGFLALVEATLAVVGVEITFSDGQITGASVGETSYVRSFFL
jgi:hypothetical protein